MKQSLVHAGVLAGILLVIALISPSLDNPARVMTSLTHITFFDVIIAIMLGVSLNLILGMAGQFSLGHAGFAAAGAYTAAVVAGKPEFFVPQLSFWHVHLGLPVGGAFTCMALAGAVSAMVVASVLGLIVGLPTLRLRGDYLAIATLGFGEIVATGITNSDYLNRTYGLRLESMWQTWLVEMKDRAEATGVVHPLAEVVRNYKVNSQYLISSFWVLGACVLTIALVRNIKYSTSGRALLAIREDVVASEAVGVPTVRYKIAAFVIGAALAGLAGAMFSHYSALNPNSFRFMYSVTIVLFVILGGQGSITGTVLAATVLTILPVVFQRNTVVDPTITEKWRMVVYALLIIVSMLFMRNGLLGRYEITDLLGWSMGKRGKKAVTSDAAAGGRGLDIAKPMKLAAGQALLNVEHVTMQFGGLKAVDDFSLRLMPGELVGLIGPNGAGKTTVFNVLTGVYRPTAGKMELAGRSIVKLKPHAISHAGAARTFQNIRLFGKLSVIDNVMIAQHAHHKQGMPSAIFRLPAYYREEEASRRNALCYLRMFGLERLAEERANSLSYGDQRRLEIARALATRPRLLLLDEPAAGMNPTEKRELMEMIRRIRTEFDLTILLIEHDMKVIMGVCERIVVLDYGKTIAAGTPEEIRRNPAVIEAYLGASAGKG